MMDTCITGTRIMDTCIMDTYIMDTCIMDTCIINNQNHGYMHAWVTRPERPKGAKDEVKQARRAQSRPEGPQARSRAPEGP